MSYTSLVSDKNKLSIPEREVIKMLLEKMYVISAEHLQDLILTNLYFMHNYHHTYTQSKEDMEKERAYVFYRMYRAKLKEMIRLQGLSNEE